MSGIDKVSGIILPEEASVIEETAAKELADFFSSLRGRQVPLLAQPAENAILLGTLGSSKLIAVGRTTTGLPRPSDYLRLSEWKIDALTDDGFVISPTIYQGKRILVIASRMPRGVLYGAFTLMEKVRLGVDDIFELNFKDEPWYEFRNIWNWGIQPKFEDLKEPKRSPELMKLVKILTSLRVNSLTLGPSTIRNQIDFTEHCTEYDSFSKFLQEYGIDLLFCVFYSPPKTWVKSHERPFCPYNPNFQQYWEELTNKLFTSITGLKGYVLKGMGYEEVPGPLSCGCKECLEKASDERILKALQVISEPLRKYEGKLFYRTWTIAIEQEIELRLFRSLVRKRGFPENVYLVTKKGYGDFMLREFPHPLIGCVRPYVPHIIELQIWGEYRGSYYFPCATTEMWGEWFRHAREKIDGLIGVASIHPEYWDHPLNMVNWYSFGRLAWNPATSPDEILNDWAKLNYGKAYPSIVKILKLATEACGKMMHMKGVWTQDHSRLPRLRIFDRYTGSSTYHTTVYIPNKIGWGKPLYLYPPEQEEEYGKDPNMTLFYSRLEISEKLKNEALRQKEEAIKLMEAAIEELKRVGPLLEPDIYKDLLERFNMNLNDAKIWRDCIALYFDYKLGKATLNAVEEVWKRHKGTRGSPLTEPFKDFVNDLREGLEKKKEV